MKLARDRLGVGVGGGGVGGGRCARRADMQTCYGLVTELCLFVHGSPSAVAENGGGRADPAGGMT